LQRRLILGRRGSQQTRQREEYRTAKSDPPHEYATNMPHRTAQLGSNPDQQNLFPALVVDAPLLSVFIH